MSAVRLGGGRGEGPGMVGSVNEAFLTRLRGVVREMDSMTAVGSIALSDGFADRIMAAIATEPMPHASFLAGASSAVRDLLAPFAAISEAWLVSMTRGRPLLVRAQAFALVLAVAFAVGSASALAAIGAGRWLAAEQRDNPAVIPAPTPPTSEGILPPTASPTPTPTFEPVVPDAPTPSAPSSDTGKPGTTTGSAPSTAAPAPHARRTPTPTERPDDSTRDNGARETDQPDAPDDHSGGGSPTSPDSPGSDPGTSDLNGSDGGS